MIDTYKNREIVYQKYESPLNTLTEGEKNEYFNSGCITIPDTNPLMYEKRIKEIFTSRKEVGKYDLENLLISEYYYSGIASDGVPVTYFLNMRYGLISTIRFSDNTMHVHCENFMFYNYLVLNLKRCHYKFDIFEDFIRINLNKNGN
jgi:hypothetical protein